MCVCVLVVVGGVRGCVRVVCDSPSFPAPNGDSDDDDEYNDDNEDTVDNEDNDDRDDDDYDLFCGGLEIKYV